MRSGESVFVDTGAWIALALVTDPLHRRAVDTWDELLGAGARLFTSVPVVLETFTFLDRNTRRDVALTWKDALDGVPRMKILECTRADLRNCWRHFSSRELHKLSAVDATSFVLMAREKIRAVFAFDHHFATAGFAMLG